MTKAMAAIIMRLSKAAKASPTLKKLYARFGGGAKAKAMARQRLKVSKEHYKKFGKKVRDPRTHKEMTAMWRDPRNVEEMRKFSKGIPKASKYKK